MKKSSKRTAAVIGGAALVAAAGTASVSAATGDDDASERPISGNALERAEQAALDEVGGGTVTGTEVDDEESKYEVEVSRDDGSQVDVQLDADFQVVGVDGDTEENETSDD